MVVLGVVLRFFQEMRADNAVEKLQAMVSNTATLMRGGKEEQVSLKMLVPDDEISSGWPPAIWRWRMCGCFRPKTCS